MNYPSSPPESLRVPITQQRPVLMAIPGTSPRRADAAAKKASWLERVGNAAIDPSDSDELRLRKTLLLLASGLMNIAAFLWLAIYWLMGLKLPTSLPLGYQFASAVLLVYYLKSKNFDHYRILQLALFLEFLEPGFQFGIILLLLKQ